MIMFSWIFSLHIMFSFSSFVAASVALSHAFPCFRMALRTWLWWRLSEVNLAFLDISFLNISCFPLLFVCCRTIWVPTLSYSGVEICSHTFWKRVSWPQRSRKKIWTFCKFVQKCPKMAQKRSKITPNGPNMTQNGPRMTQNDPK